MLEEYPDIVIATDDMYEHIYWADEPFTSFAEACPSLYDRTVTMNGVSKAYAMTGLAHWLLRRAGKNRQGDEEDSKPEHLESGIGIAGWLRLPP